MIYLQFKNKLSGFTLMEVLVSLFVVMVIALGIYNLVIISLNMNTENKMYVQAMEIANQKMEKIMNLPYDSVGVVNGIPSGNIPQTETVVRQGIFTINNYVTYYDDPFDGQMGSSTKPDTIGVDYKIATIKVSWGTKHGTESLSVFSKIIPRTMETLTGYGLLELLVNDSNGSPISQASVRVYNNTVLPMVDVVNLTDVNGYLYLPATSSSSSSYQITVTKPGYSTDQTYATSTSNPNPFKKHLSVIAGSKTSESFTIDKISYLAIKTVSQTLPVNWRVNNTHIYTRSQNLPRGSIGESNNLYFVWQDFTATSSYIKAQKYDQTPSKLWASDIKIGATTTEVNPDISTSKSGNSYIVWNDTRSADTNIYLTILDKNKNVVMADKKVNTDATIKEQSFPRIALTENFGIATSVIVWRDFRNGSNYDIYAQLFDSNGNKIWNSEKVIANSADDEISPVVAIDGNDQVYIAWVDDTGVNQDIYMQKYDLSGSSLWATNLQITSSTTDENSPSLTVDQNNDIYISWTQEASNKEVMIDKIDPSGTKLWETNANLENLNGNQYQSSLDAYSTYVYCLWTDDRYGDTNIYAQKFNLSGAAQWSSDQRLNTVASSTPQSNSFLFIDTNGNNFAVWQDYRNGDADIYATKFLDPGSQNSIDNQPLLIKGSKQIGANVLKINFATSTKAGGIITIPIEYDSIGYYVGLRATATPYTIISSDPSQPVILAPDQTANVFLFLQ